MADQPGLTPETPVTGPTESTTPPQGAPTDTAPTLQVGDKSYTLDEAKTRLENSERGYRELQGDRDRMRAELQGLRPYVDFANALQEHPDLRDKFVAEIEQLRGGAPTTTPPPGQTTTDTSQLPPEQQALAQRLERLERENEQAKWNQALDWAKGEWTNTRTNFEQIMGRKMSPQEEVRVQTYNDQTGAANIWASTLAVFQDDFLARGRDTRSEQAQLATQAAQGAVTEGGAAQAPSGPIDYAQADINDLIARGRAAAGGTVDPTYNKYVDLGTTR